MNAELQSMILAQILEELGEAKQIVLREPTDPAQLGRTDSAACRLFKLIEKAEDWAKALEEENA